MIDHFTLTSPYPMIMICPTLLTVLTLTLHMEHWEGIGNRVQNLEVRIHALLDYFLFLSFPVQNIWWNDASRIVRTEVMFGTDRVFEIFA